MTEPITRLGKEDKFFRELRKMLEGLPRSYDLAINIHGDTTRINIILLPNQEGGAS